MGPSSFFIKAGALATAVLSSSVAAAPEYLYTQDHRYAGATFFDQFNFVTGPDPTNGFVNFKSLSDAKALGLATIRGTGQAYLGVDTTNKYMDFNTYGRPSTRLESKRKYNGGLFVADFAHMPTGAGTWPAYWTVGLDSWPSGGEIDILEGINEQTQNLATLHTTTDCTLNTAAQGGTLKTSHCSNSWTDGWSQWPNQGCSVIMKEANSYGVGFNAAGGGVYVLDWQPNSNFIKVWMFTRGSAAATNALSANPDPSSWPKPSFTTEKSDCNIQQLFKDHTLILDTTFCGDYAGQFAQWSQTSIYKSNPTKYANCHDYVGAHPEAFKEAYWLVNTINVYNRSKNPSYVSSTTLVTSTTSRTTTSSATATTTPLPGGLITSPNGTCGNKYSCQNYGTLGYSCCNQWGSCGSSASDCGTGCKVGYGHCDPVATPTPLPGGLVTSPDGTCGNKYSCQNYGTLGYSCCNQWGSCGSSASDCGTGCKVGYGHCDPVATTKPTPTPTPLPGGLITSPDGTCGNKYSCQNYGTLGYSCCNQWGSCGSSASDCGTGCKIGYGHCDPSPSTTSKPTPTPTPLPGGLITSPNGTCGNKYSCQNYGGLSYSCCNQWGSCGSSASDCGAGCKAGYGFCFPTFAAPAKPDLIKSTNGSCGNKMTCTGYGALAYSCCNKYGYCGTSAEDCGAGCMKGFGACY